MSETHDELGRRRRSSWKTVRRATGVVRGSPADALDDAAEPSPALRAMGDAVLQAL